MKMQEELKKISYFSDKLNVILDGRMAVLMSFINDKKEWEIPLLSPTDGSLILMKGIPAKSTYISKVLEDKEMDIYIPFIDFVYKRASFQNLMKPLESLTNKLITLFTIVAKIDVFQSIEKSDHWVSDYVQTEIEYLLIICKSYFDELQNIIAKFWNSNVKLLNNGDEKRNLPLTYRRMVFANKKRLSSQEIQLNYKLPKKIAEFYYNTGEFYEKIKLIRDDIVHHGKTMEFLFSLPEGFAISTNSRLYKEFEVFNSLEKKGHELVSIRPFLYFLIKTILSISNDFTDTIKKVIKFPEDIIPNHNIYVRAPQLRAYLEMEKQLKFNTWWK